MMILVRLENKESKCEMEIEKLNLIFKVPKKSSKHIKFSKTKERCSPLK